MGRICIIRYLCANLHVQSIGLQSDVINLQQSSHPNKDMDEDEIILAEDKTNEGDVGSFDAIIGCIEDIVIDQKFQDMQEELLR